MLDEARDREARMMEHEREMARRFEEEELEEELLCRSMDVFAPETPECAAAMAVREILLREETQPWNTRGVEVYPPRWLLDPRWRCARGHVEKTWTIVRAGHGAIEDRMGCAECEAPVVMTFPEDA